MKPYLLFGLPVLCTAALILAAGSTTTQTQLSVTGINVSSQVVKVDVSPGVTSCTNILVGCVGPEAGHIQVRLPKLQSIDVGNITNAADALWINVTTGDFFKFTYQPTFWLRTTNNIRNVVSVTLQ